MNTYRLHCGRDGRVTLILPVQAESEPAARRAAMQYGVPASEILRIDPVPANVATRPPSQPASQRYRVYLGPSGKGYVEVKARSAADARITACGKYGIAARSISRVERVECVGGPQ
jgi:hypothetical protein